MIFDWAPWKADSNTRKHRVTLGFGVRVFDDPWHVDVDASRDEDGEKRRKAIGLVAGLWIQTASQLQTLKFRSGSKLTNQLVGRIPIR